MPESIIATAFIIGLISASSLPLGAVTASFWRPSDRMTAILMAFGGGALLAALTIDLVASAVEKGYFYPLAAGSIIGGLLFLGLNQIVNDYGGFLRKVSTNIYHLRRKQHQHIQQIVSRINRVDLFRRLPMRDFKIIAPTVQTMKFNQGKTIYSKGDPADEFFIVAEGDIDIYDHGQTEQLIQRLGPGDVIGWKACMTATPYAVTAIPRTEATLWSIPKRALDSLLLNSPQFQQEVHLLLRSEELLAYLTEYHGLSREEASDWTGKAVKSLIKRGVLPPAIEVSRNQEEFLAHFQRLRRFPLIQDLPLEEQQLMCRALLYKHYQRGEPFYIQHTPADRMYFIEQGEVHLIDPAKPPSRATVLGSDDSFGGLSMLTGARRATTAVAVDDTSVWELRRSDLEPLLASTPVLASRFRRFVQQGEAASYLESRHLNSEQAARWSRQALRSLDLGEPLPPAAEIAREIKENEGAPVAIWLGITLDGIPESLVIGASLIHTHISLSLVAGLFLSNYPEALSSSTGMRQQGFSFPRILLMWSSLTLLTGIGAALGSHFFVNASPPTFALVQGVAAGAMLTMIAETMLPEAYFKGGSVVGISTLSGFLVAIFFTTLEGA